MKTIRRKYKRRITSRYKNKKSKKYRQSLRQKKCKTKKIYNYRRKYKKIHQHGGEGSDDDEMFSGRASSSDDEDRQLFFEIPDPDLEELYDEGEEPATAVDIERVIKALEQEPSTPKVLQNLQELYRYRFPSDGVSCMDRPSRNTLFGKVFEEQIAKKYFMEYYPGDWKIRFEEYLSSSNTAEHDIPARLTDGVLSVSVKSKRIGRISPKVTLTLKSASSYKLCSAKAVRFVNQLLSGQPLQLVVVYYRLESDKVVPDPTMRVYDITSTSQLNAIWGGYTTQAEREDLVRRIEHLSQLFVDAQNGTSLQIQQNLQIVREMVGKLQREMKHRGSLISLAHKISSSCGKIEGGCKEQCRLQVVLDVEPLSEGPPFISDLLSPTFFRAKPSSVKPSSAKSRRQNKVSLFSTLLGTESDPTATATSALFQPPIATAALLQPSTSTAALLQPSTATAAVFKPLSAISGRVSKKPRTPTPSRQQSRLGVSGTSINPAPKTTSSTRGIPRWVLQSEMEESRLKSGQPDMPS